MMRQIEVEYMLTRSIQRMQHTEKYVTYLKNYNTALALIDVLYLGRAAHPIKIAELNSISNYVLEHKILDFSRYED